MESQVRAKRGFSDREVRQYSNYILISFPWNTNPELRATVLGVCEELYNSK